MTAARAGRGFLLPGLVFLFTGLPATIALAIPPKKSGNF